MILADVKAPYAALERLGALVRAPLNKALNDAGAFHTRIMGKERFGPYRAQSYEDKLQTRGGALRSSFGWAVNSGEMRLFSAGVRYAKLQEYGGTITPTRKQWLKVPTLSALTSAGRLKGGDAIVRRGDHFETANGQRTFIFKARSGFLYVGVKGPNGKPRALYRLTKSVTIKPRLGFHQTFEDRTLPFLRLRLEQALREVIQ